MEYAEDFTDEEILEIEQYLRGLAFQGIGGNIKRNDFGTYVIWRMAIEYGLRISEMLAARLQDLPSRTQNHLKIVRVEERNNPPDPRGKRALRPKTLSRDLGTYFANSSFPDLFAKYLAEYRWIEVFNAKRGVMRRKSNGLSRWPSFTMFLDAGRVAIDNNPAERSMRPIGVGRRNWLFAGSDTGGETMARAMTIIETAKMNGSTRGPISPMSSPASTITRSTG